jgi:membrane glycosyltransferase
MVYNPIHILPIPSQWATWLSSQHFSSRLRSNKARFLSTPPSVRSPSTLLATKTYAKAQLDKLVNSTFPHAAYNPVLTTPPSTIAMATPSAEASRYTLETPPTHTDVD